MVLKLSIGRRQPPGIAAPPLAASPAAETIASVATEVPDERGLLNLTHTLAPLVVLKSPDADAARDAGGFSRRAEILELDWIAERVVPSPPAMRAAGERGGGGGGGFFFFFF